MFEFNNQNQLLCFNLCCREQLCPVLNIMLQIKTGLGHGIENDSEAKNKIL